MNKTIILFRWLRRFYSWLALWPVEEPPPGNTNTMNTMITNIMKTMITNTMNAMIIIPITIVMLQLTNTNIMNIIMI